MSGVAVVEGEPRSRNDAQPLERLLVLAGEDMRAHDAGEGVAVGDPDPRKPELRRPRHHLLGMRGPAQEREIRRRRQFGEARLDHHLLSAGGEKVARSAG